MWGEAACFRDKHAVQTHPAVPLDRAAKGGSIDRNRVVAVLIIPPRDHFEEAIPVSARNRSGHSRLGREMVVDTGALDADLGCKIAEAEAPVARFADASLGQVHQALRRFVPRISYLY